MAVKALSTGEADKDQQIRAFNCIVYTVLGLKESPYSPDSTHDMAYAIGRQDAARELALYMTLPTEDLKKLSNLRKGNRANAA